MTQTLEEIIEAGKAKVAVLEQQKLAKEKARAAFIEDQENKTFDLALELIPEALHGYATVLDETLFIHVPGCAELSHQIDIRTQYVDFGFGEYAYAVDSVSLERISKKKGWRLRTWQVYDNDGEWVVELGSYGDGKRIDDFEEAMATASIVNVEQKDAVALAAQRNEAARAEKERPSVKAKSADARLICPILSSNGGEYVNCVREKCALWIGGCGLGGKVTAFYGSPSLGTMADGDLTEAKG